MKKMTRQWCRMLIHDLLWKLNCRVLDNVSGMCRRDRVCGFHVLRDRAGEFSKMGAVTNMGESDSAGISTVCFPKTLLNRVLRENLGDLYQYLHMSRLCHLTDRRNARALRGLNALNRLGLWGFQQFSQRSTTGISTVFSTTCTRGACTTGFPTTSSIHRNCGISLVF